MTRERGSGKTPESVVSLLREEVQRSSMLAVSRATGIGLAAIGRYLKGIGEPTTATLEKLAQYFEVTTDYLRGTGAYSTCTPTLEKARELKKGGPAAEIRWLLAANESLTGVINEVKVILESDNEIPPFVFEKIPKEFDRLVQEFMNLPPEKRDLAREVLLLIQHQHMSDHEAAPPPE